MLFCFEKDGKAVLSFESWGDWAIVDKDCTFHGFRIVLIVAIDAIVSIDSIVAIVAIAFIVKFHFFFVSLV